MYEIGFFFNPTEKVIETIIVDVDELTLFVFIHDSRKIGINCSKLGSNGQLLKNPTRVIFGYGNP